jgi:Cu+-exporting ATPase
MMLSFPEYLGLEEMKDSSLRVLFGYLNLFLSIPVVFYCANEYFISAFKGLKNKLLNIDVPIALGTSAVFIRSIYEVISQTGPGYFDSLTGLVFFLLIGKWVQKSTYQKFSFERDYQSYFPAAVIKIEHEKESIIPVNDLKEGDEILIRNHEIIPADAILKSGIGHIDYSFVSGEALPVTKHEGMLLYAGGKQIGNSIRLQVTKDFSQSYFLQLWNKEIFTKKSNAYLSSFVLSFSKYFTIGTLVIALGTFLYWYFTDASKALFPVTSVLLVACPCSLALSLPFALSNCLRLMGKKGLYLKSADTVEMLSEIDTIVFDKTGTLTETDLSGIEYVGDGLLAKEIVYVRSAAQHSLHPLSQALYRFLDKNTIETHSFEEIPSCGICCTIDDVKIKLGSADFVGEQEEKNVHEARVYISINGYYKGYYKVKNQYREEMEYFTALLGKYYELHVLSGDNNSEQKKLSAFFKRIKFNQTPQDKLEYIEKLKLEGKKVLMLGDGLNDAGALKAATVGIAVSDNTCNFSPSCDGILEGKKIKNLFSFLAYSKAGIRIIHLSLILSLIYNAIGLYFAVQGLLSPVIAAILMPMSSVTVVLFVVVATSVRAREL